jgi:hypothetical protein
MSTHSAIVEPLVQPAVSAEQDLDDMPLGKVTRKRKAKGPAPKKRGDNDKRLATTKVGWVGLGRVGSGRVAHPPTPSLT